MNILIVIDDYLPNSTRVSAKMMHDLALYLKSNGHDITVITPNNKPGSNLLVKDQLDGINVWRFKSGTIKDISRVKRLINESLLSKNAWNAIKNNLGELNIDGIINYSPSIFFGHLVSKLKKFFNCKSYLVLRDLFPQWAIDEKIIGEYSPITYYLRYFEDKNYRSADKIGLMSEKNIQVFNKYHAQYKNLEVLPNWVPNNEQLTSDNVWRNKLGLNNKIILLYGGNIGKAQDMPNLLRLVLATKEIDNAHFLFVGQGESFQEVNNFISDNSLTNITLMDSISQEDFKNLLSEVDIGLFSLAKSHTAHNFPGKILGYIAYNLPILGSVNPGNDLMGIINNNEAGFVYENGNDELLLQACKQLISSPELRQECGNNAKALLDSHFSVKSAANKILNSLH